MLHSQLAADLHLVNGSTGDPVLFVDYPDADNALLFDAGDNCRLTMERLADLRAVFITHHHVDHFIGLDRIVRANIDSDKVLSIFGPPGTIQKIYDRIKSYEYQYFPFQRIVLDVVDVGTEHLWRARLEYSKRFPEPQPTREPRASAEIFATDIVRIEATYVDHTIPCLAYALIEKPGYHLRPEALMKGVLKPGSWIRTVAQKLRHGSPNSEQITIEGGSFSLGILTEMYYRKTPGGRLAFVTDTAWTDEVQQRLIPLVGRADRLFCDSFYAEAQLTSAKKHKHMTASAAASLANVAEVKQLTLIHFSSRYRGKYEILLDEARKNFANVTAEIL